MFPLPDWCAILCAVEMISSRHCDKKYSLTGERKKRLAESKKAPTEADALCSLLSFSVRLPEKR